MNSSIKFISVPKDIIYDTELSNRRVLVFSYLYARWSLDDTVTVVPTWIEEWSHTNTDGGRSRLAKKYTEDIIGLIYKGFLKGNVGSIQAANKNVPYLLKVNPDRFHTPKSFGVIYFDELNKIFNFKETLTNTLASINNITIPNILLILAYIRANINKNIEKPRCCYRHYTKIAEDLGISGQVVSRTIKVLTALNIIAESQTHCHVYENDDDSAGQSPIYVPGVHVFADCRRFIKDEDGVIEDLTYNPQTEIDKQIKILEHSF